MSTACHARAPRPARRRRGLEGFTLIETMIALTILAIGLLAMLGLQLQALRQSEWGRHSTDAARIARDQLELFSRMSWNDPQMQPTAWTAPVAMTKTVQTATGAAQEQTFAMQWRITTDASDPDLRHIDVRVVWRESNQDGNAPPRRYAVSSMRYNS